RSSRTPVITWLSGHGSPPPGNSGLGWTYRDEAAMAAFSRPLEDPLVEQILIERLKVINSNVKIDAQARLATAALRNLKQKLRTGWRGTLVTTIQSFQQMDD